MHGKSTKSISYRSLTSYTSQKSVKSINLNQQQENTLKVSEGGHIVANFQTKFKKKCMEDNLNVMATLVKRKIKYLDKKEMLLYLKKLMDRNNNCE